MTLTAGSPGQDAVGGRESDMSRSSMALLLGEFLGLWVCATNSHKGVVCLHVSATPTCTINNGLFGEPGPESALVLRTHRLQPKATEIEAEKGSGVFD
jgi:hypothetical protein